MTIDFQTYVRTVKAAQLCYGGIPSEALRRAEENEMIGCLRGQGNFEFYQRVQLAREINTCAQKHKNKGFDNQQVFAMSAAEIRDYHAQFEVKPDGLATVATEEHDVYTAADYGMEARL